MKFENHYIGLPGTLFLLAALLFPVKLLAATSLNIGSVHSPSYGFGFNGVYSNPTSAEFEFQGNRSDITLVVSAFDVDIYNEVAVELNGSVVAHLDTTDENSVGVSRVLLPLALQRNGINSLRFIQTQPGWLWGVQNILLSTENTPTLQANVVDTGTYGNRPGGSFGNVESVTFNFPYSASGYSLQLDTWDIDSIFEIDVQVNGQSISSLPTTGDNSNGNALIPIGPELLQNGNNTLEFKSNFPTWVWEVSNILLSQGTSVTLALDSTENGVFGFGFAGNYSNKERAEFDFIGVNGDIELSVETFDIDTADEVTVILNGLPIGNLETTPSDGTGHSSIFIPQALQVPGTNTISFVQNVPGYTWGINSLLLYGCAS